MLRIITNDDIKFAVEHCWRQYLDPKTRVYPVNACKSDMELALKAEMQDKDGLLWGYWANGELAGVCGFYFETEKRYLRILTLCAWDQTELAFEEFFQAIESEFPEYEIEIGIAPENTNVAEILSRHGYKSIEIYCDLRYDALSVDADLNLIEGVQLLIDDNDNSFEEYAPLHDQWFSETYWNSQRLREFTGDWQVVIQRQSGRIESALLAIEGHNTLGIECLHANDTTTTRNLICGLLQQNEMSEYGADLILYMVRTDEKERQEVAYSCGFVLFGFLENWMKSNCNSTSKT